MSHGGGLQRIVVAVDDSAPARAAVEAAAELARRVGASVTALFVEDQELLHAAGLPFVHEIGPDAAARPFDAPRVERRFRSVVRLARETCDRASARCRVEVRLQVIRGTVAREIVAAAERADIVFLGRSAKPPSTASARGRARERLGRTTRSVLDSAVAQLATVAVVPAQARDGRPVVVAVDAAAPSTRALELAELLDGQGSGGLVVLLVGARDEAHGDTRHDAHEDARRVEPPVPGARVLGVEASATAVLNAARALDGRAIVVARDTAGAGAALASAVVASADCPVFVVG